MNILFLTLAKISNLQEETFYTDLLNEFVNQGCNVYGITPIEKRDQKRDYVEHKGSFHLLHVNIGNYFHTGKFQKGITLLTLESKYIRGIKRYLKGIRFDLILYATPPVCLVQVIAYIKQRDKAKSYLMLKDIFPQNAVDLGMMKKGGIYKPLYWYFRRKEKRLYAISDHIGCMSKGNVHYVLKHNPEIDRRKTEVCPNAAVVIDKSLTDKERVKVREKYAIPLDATAFIYGGNLGKPQGIDFLIQCLERMRGRKDCFFLIVGDGTEYGKLEKYIKKHDPVNIRLMRKQNKADYEQMAGACDVGMIFLDYRFTIPNIPSRLLSYMTVKLPVLAVTDPNTDIGKIAAAGKFGWWCESNSVDAFEAAVENCLVWDLKGYGENGFQYMKENYSVKVCCSIIMRSYKRNDEG